jgi:hypothetical protein
MSRHTPDYRSAIEEFTGRARQCRDAVLCAERAFQDPDAGDYNTRRQRWLQSIPALGNDALVLMAGICSFLEWHSAARPGFRPVSEAIQKLPLYRDPPTHIQNLTSEAVDDLKSVERLLASLRLSKKASLVHRLHPKDKPGATAAAQTAKQLRADGKTFQEICGVLANSARPPRAKWKHLPWPKAFADPDYHGAVKTWLSKAING